MKLKRGGWEWHLEDPAVLEPWVDRMEKLAETPLKRNGVRRVFRTEDAEHRGCFVKLERKKGILNRIRNRFFSKAEAEYESGRLLEACGIPCVEYLAWGRRGAESVLVSRALENTRSALEYWYSCARFDGTEKERWLNAFFDLAFRFCRNNLCHSDFHAGNVLYRPESGEAVLVDVYGIRRKERLDEKDLRDLLHWLLPLRMDVSDEELIERLDRRGILRFEAEPFFREMVHLESLRVEHDWEKRRRKQILSGNSKFSRTEGRREIRNALWFEPSPLPDESQLEMREMGTEEAEKIWLDSFHRQLLAEKLHEVPLIREKIGDKSRLFLLSGNKKSYFF